MNPSKPLANALTLACLVLGAVTSTPTLATLLLRDANQDGLADAVYDAGRNTTWLLDANFARSSGYDANGRMSWSAANRWASALVVGGYSDWQLPVSWYEDPSCSRVDSLGQGLGLNCVGSQMPHLWYEELGNIGGELVTHSAPFQNLMQGDYWSRTAFHTDADYGSRTDYAYYFDMAVGELGYQYKTVEMYATAVRNGDVFHDTGNGGAVGSGSGSASNQIPGFGIGQQIPEPGAFWLSCLALGLLVGQRLRPHVVLRVP